MNITWHNLVSFIVGVLVMAPFVWVQRRRAKENAEISSILRDRKP
jgi:hypothetical protein